MSVKWQYHRLRACNIWCWRPSTCMRMKCATLYGGVARITTSTSNIQTPSLYFFSNSSPIAIFLHKKNVRQYQR
ncbi:hypothetical protein AHF37_11641 [Paragonimus kellicotti]|nr:hypothetical protein AHF37_11641 [Paragonimus kellicotti]